MKLLHGIGNIVGTLEGGSREPLARGSISINKLSKRFRKHTLAKKSYSTIKTSFLSRIFARRFPPNNYIQALENISIEIPAGRAVGLVGRNGSGKSTLLKLIAGIYRPDAGTLQVTGKISALIELGAGFHPDFTGRENIYLGGVMYGLSRADIEARFESIVRYAELEDCIDDPVRTYSSGMYMRLGFSLAVHTDPDILLIDEVLAVGDAGFIHRCKETISEFKRRGKTMVFVTHDLDAIVRWCDEALWLQDGRIVERGDPQRIVDSYLQTVVSKEEKDLARNNDSLAPEDFSNRPEPHRWGAREVEILNVRMLSSAGEAHWLFRDDDQVTVEVHYRIDEPLEDLVFGVGIIRADGLVVHGNNTDIDRMHVPLPEDELGGEGIFRYQIERLQLVEGSYFLDVAAHRSDGYPYDYHHLRYKFSVRTNTKQQGVMNPVHAWSFEPKYQVRAEVEKKEPRARSTG